MTQLYVYIHTYIISQILFHYRLLQDIEYSSPSCRVDPCCLSMLYKLKDTCSLEGKLLQTYRQCIRDITLLTKVCIVKVTVFPVVMYRYESWTIKKTERRRIDAFELWCWRRLLRVPWTAKSSKPSILKEINPECSLADWWWSWNSNTLAIWCEEPTHWKRLWLWERLKAKGEEGGIG